MKALVMALGILSFAAAPATEESALASVYDLFRQGDQEGAARELHELVVRYPASSELRALYVNLLTRREPERAWELARQLERARPDDAWSWYAVAAAGILEPGTEHLAEGLAALEKMTALAKEPLPDAMLRLKVTGLLRVGREEEALKVLGNREDAAALALKAMIRESDVEGGDAALDEADALYRRARAAAPDDVRIAASYVHFLQDRERPEAGELARELVAKFPLSLRAHEMYWHTILESRSLTTPQKEAAIAEDAARLLAARDWPENLQALAGWYRRIESARELETHDAILQRHPWAPEAEYALYRKLFSSKARLTADPEVLAARRRAIQEFLEYPVHSTARLGGAYQQLLSVNRLDPTVSDAEILRAVDGVRAFVTEPMGAKTMVAEVLAERGLRLEEAEKLAREGLRETPRMLELQRGSYTAEEYDRTVSFLRARAGSALGAVLLKRNKLTEAGKELQAAAKLSPRDPNLNLQLGRWYERKKDAASAELAYARGMIHEPATSTQNLDALRALYKRTRNSEEGFDVYVANLREAGASDDKRKVLAGRLIPARRVEPPFTLKDLSGKQVSLADVKGHVAVVNFWGLWCGPCLAEMPDLHKLHQKYAADPKVRILTINNDNDPAKVASWMEKNGYAFPVLVDDGYVRKARVYAMPTTWFLDPQGKIAFEAKGAVVNLVDEFSWRIDALKAVGR
ncbi:MAG TPA: redoxin domain-containing protein [Thermoanaerobaculia bacterium]|jgi:thiol-disulfide isomerase/thioredoxin